MTRRGIACPKCGDVVTRVVRRLPDGVDAGVRRMRRCSACGQRFTTHERVTSLVRRRGTPDRV